MSRRKVWALRAGALLAAGAMVAGLAGVSTAGGSGGVKPLARGGTVSGVARPEAAGSVVWGSAPNTTCKTPGNGNYQADCNSTGAPVNETTIATNGTKFVAGANDYNSYNGNADLGYYTSTDGKTWTDNGPLDLFAQGPRHAAGDPGLAIDAAGVVYYSGIYFDYDDCNIGGVELARRDPATGSWTYYEIDTNDANHFQDKPAIMQRGGKVFVAWVEYDSCFDAGTATMKVAVFKAGADSVPPTKILTVPGSSNSQGAALATDGGKGFWLAWEEYTGGAKIMLAHWSKATGWSTPQKISPAGFRDLPSPLPGFRFRNDSFPAITLSGDAPQVVWTSYDTGKGRCYLWANDSVTLVKDSGGHQFFPSIATDAQGEVA
ncbi:MAG: hypothetical protein E6G44_11620, partial [Actinobacteria bacterium]